MWTSGTGEERPWNLEGKVWQEPEVKELGC